MTEFPERAEIWLSFICNLLDHILAVVPLSVYICAAQLDGRSI
jgi:hypothetical protein